MIITQIVPQLPPVINGLGDYALNLAAKLKQDFGIETHFIVGDPTQKVAREINSFSVSQVMSRSATSLLSLLPSSSSTVLLQYVNYGYAKRGCPFWLVEGLQRWQMNGIHQRLITMFHEVAASGPPWTSAFWLSQLQNNLAARLTQLSNFCVTNRELHAKTLQEYAKNQPLEVAILPVFSNVGEPQQVPPSLIKRQWHLVVFGSQNSRLQVYQQHLKALAKTCQALNIEKIYDIGVPTGLNLSRLIGISVVETGVIPSTAICEILMNSIAGFMNFPPPEHLGKSTIFAAYCAYRLIPILTSATPIPIDGLSASKQYWNSSNPEQLSLNFGQTIADNAYAWYQTHNLSIQAKVFSNFFNK